ncbi:MAG: polyketide synthase [Pseudomonadota bacterium]|nr:polyketide synthase [Pseudomonadota bacterium]
MPSQPTAAELRAAMLPDRARDLATAIVAAHLRTMFAGAKDECPPADSITTLRPSHRRWLASTVLHLARHELLSPTSEPCQYRFAAGQPVEQLWSQWDASMQEWRGNANHHAYLALIEACLRELPDILSGAVPATDVMFPESSMHMVEGIYKQNLIADHFNTVLAESLRLELAAKAARGDRALRMLEIGAGTGGTTTALLPMLRGFGDLIEEYCYTDLSKAFLLHAEEHYRPELPMLRTAIFDVGKPLALQSIEANRYDVVIATNVLHATSNMRETLRNAKAALKRGGVLLVNELSDWSWYTHFTFGLLEGWWLYEDENLRVPGSPLLSPRHWENLLRNERFFDVRFPASDQHELGQQILAARSDGVVRQRFVSPATPATPAMDPAPRTVRNAPAQPVPAAPSPEVATDDAALRDACSSLFRDTIAGALRMDVREIETHKPLEQYGLDSILVVQLTTRFRKLFPAVRSTLFFEVKTIDGLVQHFLAADQAAVLRVLSDHGVHLVAALSGPAAQPIGERSPSRRFAPRRDDGVVRQRFVSPATPGMGPAPSTVRVALALPVPAAPSPALATDAAALREACSSLFRETIAGALRMDVREIETHKPLEQYGLDSILVVQLTTRFRKLFPAVRSTLFFEVKSIDGLVQHFLAADRTAVLRVLSEQGVQPAAAPILGEPDPSGTPPAARPIGQRSPQRRLAPRRDVAMTSPAQPETPPAPSSPALEALASRFDVAVIGLSGRYPQSPDLERFWENLASGRNCVTEIPAERWNWQEFYDPEKGKDGKSYTRWGGFLEDVDKFDPLFFRIAPKEAKRIDPQERLFLETSYHAIEDSGYTPATLSSNGKVGVFVGVMNSRYTVQPLYYSIANRVSFLFDFSGPSFAVDSACSSSLTAIHLALESLHGGMCDIAIAGGVSLIIDPQHMLELTAVGMLSEGGECRSFGRDADGFVDAEGVGAVILKPLSQAIRDGDNICGVIKGSAVNTGGRTHGYTVPNPVAQAGVVSAALARANISAEDVSYIEAHGTGTALGDPIEISGLTKAFRTSSTATPGARAMQQHCAIGSLKSNIGHCESAAGIAALTKVLLQLRHGQLVPTLHVDRINDEIDFPATPFRPQRELAAWQRLVVDENGQTREVPRIAGISSFGAGGANAHVVVQEYQPASADAAAQAKPDIAGPCLVPLSARTAEQLQIRIQQLLAFLQRSGADIGLHELAHTLQVGREAMDERIALVAASMDDLLQQLRILSGTQRPRVEPARGSVRRSKAFLAACRSEPGFERRCQDWMAGRDYARIAEHWVQGIDFDWALLYNGARPIRVSLPGYPFARDRHWMEPQRSLTNETTGAATHPLLQRNTSALRHPSYSTVLSGDEPFLEQSSPGQRQFPSLLCIEMARAAIASSYPDDTSRNLVFEDVVWDDAIDIQAGCELHIALLPDRQDALRFEVFGVRDGTERVHCQGRARFAPAAAPRQVDLAAMVERLRSGVAAEAFNGRLAALGLACNAEPRVVGRASRSGRELTLELSRDSQAAAGHWGLEPEVLASVVQGAVWMLGEAGQLPAGEGAWCFRSVGAARIDAPLERQGYLVLTCSHDLSMHSGESTWEAGIYDSAGKSCLQMSGLQLVRLHTAADAIAAVPAEAPAVILATTSDVAPAGTPPSPTKPTRPVLLSATESAFHVPAATAKPRTLSLAGAGDLASSVAVSSVGRQVVSLAEPASATITSEDTSKLDVQDLGQGIFSFVFAQPAMDAGLVGQLLQALDFVGARADAKVLLITGSDSTFLHGGREQHDNAIDAGLYRALVEFPLPIVALMQGDASGAGFMVAALSDFMLGSPEGRYAFADANDGFHPTMVETDLLAARFGDAWADDLLHIAGAQNGRELADKGYPFSIVDRPLARAAALELAGSIAAKPRTSLRLLKQRMAEGLQPHVRQLGGERPAGPAANSSGKPPRAATSGDLPRDPKGISVERLSASVLSVRLTSPADSTPSRTLLTLSAVLAELCQRDDCSALVLSSEHPRFLPSIDDDGESALASLCVTLSEYPFPVLVAFEHDCDGAGWLLGLSADACIYRADGHYSAEELWGRPALLRSATALFARRLGANRAKRLLLDATGVTGAELASCAGISAAAEDVLSKALTAVEALPLRFPALLEQWRTRNRVWRDEASATDDGGQQGLTAGRERGTGSSMPVSPVVETEVLANGVIVVRMADREARNMFSPELIRGLEDVFAHIDASDEYRAVVLCGYDTFFACGGTRESLLAIQRGTAKFTDDKIYQLPMSCKVPVIAAMQGHAIGGGWTLGMFADLCIFSEESRYISPYMQYGFTPGAGSTLIFPETLGRDLARETLFTAAEHTGSELRAKGLPHACHPRNEVMSRALAIAGTIATMPPQEVRALKRHFSRPCLAVLEDTYDREVAMHEASFVGQSHALEGVMQHFAADEAPGAGASVSRIDVAAEPVAPPVSTPLQHKMSQSEIVRELKTLLAAELQMSVADIDEDTQFVDLGLDSITGVTWVRKINGQYRVRIEATKVYSHPTLRQFSDFVAELVGAAGQSETRASSIPADVAGTTTSGAAATAPAAADSEDQLCAALKGMLAQELHMAEADIDEDRQFVELGLDSITGVTWLRRINAAYGTRIEATKVYSHPTLIEFTRFLGASLPVRPGTQRLDALASTAASVVKPTNLPASSALAKRGTSPPRGLTSWRTKAGRARPSTASASDAIAVIGVAGQFPQAKNLETFWQNIASAKDCIDIVPLQRWDAERLFSEDISVPGTLNSRWMGVLEDCDAFDPLFFNISPTEAESMDPQQRLMLQSCWHTIEDAAVDPRSLSGSRCGVFIGCGATDYHQRSREHQLSTQGFTGAAMSILAARISYFLNLQGPCLSIDTACSSSLVAISNACDSLIAGNCDIALAGGVAVMAGPTMHVKTSQSGMLSVDGRCFTFDHRANGFVPSEGVGTVMLKRLADAERDGDIVQAVIRGWGVNQDGKTNGITAPNPVSQTRLMRDIYDKFGVDPEDIQLIEAHGTGTRLGDPIEVEGLTQAFRHYTPNAQYCSLGSIKSNIGHCLYAAGIAGVLKLVLALKHRQLPPSANFQRLNPHIDLAGSPFVINTELKDWPLNKSGGRTAVVSSFGFSGTNAHLVLEGPQERSTSPADAMPPRPAIIPLSAKTPEQLRQSALQLADYIDGAKTAPSLQDISYTLQVGRQPMEERCALVARTPRDLAGALREFAAGKLPQDAWVGTSHSRVGKLAFIGQDRALQAVLIGTCLSEGKLDKLAELWADGIDLPWESLHQDAIAAGRRPRRIPLPLYPFAKERYWLQDDAAVDTQPATAPGDTIHPLLHANVSTLRQQRYRSVFSGNEFFLRDHRVRLAKDQVENVLPGVAYLEMAAAAIANALPERAASERLMLGNVVWWRPVVVSGATTVEIELGVDDSDAIIFEICSGAGDQRLVHCQGEAEFVEATTARKQGNAFPGCLPQGDHWSSDDIYAAFGQVGLHYGPAHRGLLQLTRAGGRVIANVALPTIPDDSESFRLHPSVMDAVLQACIGFIPSLQRLPDDPAIPFALGSLTIHAPCPAEVVAVLAPLAGATAGTNVEACDVSIFAPDGTLCVEIHDFRWRAVGKGSGASAQAHVDPQTLDEAFYRELLDSISSQEMSAEEAAELGLLS